MTRISLLSAAAVTTIAFSAMFTQAHAQARSPVCAERSSLISQLESRHGEVRRSVGLQQDSGVIETYANVETGTWTIIVTLPTGLSCLIAVGENWSEDEVASAVADEAA